MLENGTPEASTPNGEARKAPTATPIVCDPRRAPAVAGLEACSDEQLIELMRSDPGNAIYLLAFYYRYQALISGLLQSEVNPAALAQRCWFSAFDVLLNQQQNVLPVSGWLGRLVAQSIINRGPELTGGTLPAPLAWSLTQALEQLPPLVRVALVLVEAGGYSRDALLRYLNERGLALSSEEAASLHADAQLQFAERVPVQMRELYFANPAERVTPVLLLAQLGLNLNQEMRRFERWQGLQAAYEQEAGRVPPVAQPMPTAAAGRPQPPESRNWQPLVGLLLVAFGSAALGAFAYLTWRAPQPIEGELSSAGFTSEAILPPQAQTPVPEPAPKPATPPVAGKTPAPVSETRAMVRSTAVAKEAPPVAPPSPASTVSSPAPATPVAVSAPAGVIDLAPGVAPRARRGGYVVLGVADPDGTVLARIRQLQPRAIARVIEGQTYVQFGAFRNPRQAAFAAELLRKNGFTPSQLPS